MAGLVQTLRQDSSADVTVKFKPQAQESLSGDLPAADRPTALKSITDAFFAKYGVTDAKPNVVTTYRTSKQAAPGADQSVATEKNQKATSAVDDKANAQAKDKTHGPSATDKMVDDLKGPPKKGSGTQAAIDDDDKAQTIKTPGKDSKKADDRQERPMGAGWGAHVAFFLDCFIYACKELAREKAALPSFEIPMKAEKDQRRKPVNDVKPEIVPVADKTEKNVAQKKDETLPVNPIGA